MALRQIVKEEGTVIFQEPLRFWSIAEDHTAGTAPEDMALLMEIIQLGLLENIEKIYTSRGRRGNIRQVMKTITEKTQRDEETVTEFMKKLCEAYGWKCPFSAPPTPMQVPPKKDAGTSVNAGSTGTKTSSTGNTGAKTGNTGTKTSGTGNFGSMGNTGRTTKPRKRKSFIGRLVRLCFIVFLCQVILWKCGYSLPKLNEMPVLSQIFTMTEGIDLTEIPVVSNLIDLVNQKLHPEEPAAVGNYVGCDFQNISEGGVVVSDDEGIYYVNSDNKLKIFRMDHNGNNKKKLTKISAYYLNTKDGWLYFARSDKDRSLYKMRTDGSDLQVLCEAAVYEPKLVNDWIYFNKIDDDYSLWRIHLDGSGEELVIGQRAYYCCYYDDHIFFLNASDSYKGYYMNMDGSDPVIWNKGMCECLDIEDGILYYSLQTKGGIYAVEAFANAKNSTTITDEHNTSLNVSDGWIYFSNLSDNHALYKIDIDGNLLIKLTDRYSRFINVDDGWVYFRDSSDKKEIYYKITVNGEQEQKVS